MSPEEQNCRPSANAPCHPDAGALLDPLQAGRPAERAQEFLPALVALFEDPDSQVRIAALRAVAELGPPARQLATRPLIQSLARVDRNASEETDAVLKALSEIGADSDEAVWALLECVAYWDGRVYRTLEETVGPAGLVERLEKWLNDPNWVRDSKRIRELLGVICYLSWRKEPAEFRHAVLAFLKSKPAITSISNLVKCLDEWWRPVELLLRAFPDLEPVFRPLEYPQNNAARNLMGTETTVPPSAFVECFRPWLDDAGSLGLADAGRLTNPTATRQLFWMYRYLWRRCSDYYQLRLEPLYSSGYEEFETHPTFQSAEDVIIRLGILFARRILSSFSFFSRSASRESYEQPVFFDGVDKESTEAAKTVIHSLLTRWDIMMDDSNASTATYCLYVLAEIGPPAGKILGETHKFLDTPSIPGKVIEGPFRGSVSLQPRQRVGSLLTFGIEWFVERIANDGNVTGKFLTAYLPRTRGTDAAVEMVYQNKKVWNRLRPLATRYAASLREDPDDFLLDFLGCFCMRSIHSGTLDLTKSARPSLIPYMRSALYTYFIDQCRLRKHDPTSGLDLENLIAVDHPVDRHFTCMENMDALKKALQCMSDDLRVPLLLRMAGWSNQMIGEKMGYSEGTTRRRVLKAKTVLRQLRHKFGF